MRSIVKKLRNTAIALAATVQMSGLLALVPTPAAALSSGSLTPTLMTGNVAITSGDHNWDNATNGSTSNNQYASTTITSSSDISNYLRATGFGFAIPNNAVINGISVGIERKEKGDANSNIRDNSVRLVKSNAVVGDNKATNANWPSTDTVANYGSTSDLWGTTWTPAEVNSANFGVALSVGRTSNGDETALVDSFSISVEYSIPTQADLIITKTNNVSGSVVIGNSFTWTLTVQNNGTASAVFDNQTILIDELPTNADYSPTNNIAVVKAGGTTGDIDCDINNNVLDCADNSGSPSVTIPVGGSFSVTFTVTPEELGTLNNPRTMNDDCKVDPDNDVSESNEQNNKCSDSVVVGKTVSLPNPSLGETCGLDIALVLDNSGSIDASELSSMKSAMNAFVTAFAGTPTQFSVTSFGTTATVEQAFTANTANVTAAINGITEDAGSTNWEDGLVKAQGTFDPRPAKANLVVFASDGNPNRVDNGTSVSEVIAVDQAVQVANTIKAGGTKVIALGIGNNLDTANLQAISSVSDVITSDFATLAADLAELASELCGGTITITKLIDADGKANTTNDRTPAQNWQFDINGTPSNPAPQMTDVNGSTTPQDVDPGTYSITETLQPGYKVLDVDCSINQQAVGSWTSGATISNITVGAQDIVTCTYVNAPADATITINKYTQNNNSGTAQQSNDPIFQNYIYLNGYEGSWTLGSSFNLMPNFQYTLGENDPYELGYTFDGVNCFDVSNNEQIVLDNTFTAMPGQQISCTVFNDDIAHPEISVEKYGPDSAQEGEEVYYYFAVTNTGDVNLSGVSIADDIAGDPTYYYGDDGDYVLEVGETWWYEITYTVPNETTENIVNTVNVCAYQFGYSGEEYDSEGPIKFISCDVDECSDDFEWDARMIYEEYRPTVVCDDDSHEMDVIHPEIKVVKSGPNSAPAGSTVAYTFTVTNPGDIELAVTSVEDDIAGSGTYVSGDTDLDMLLDLDEAWIYQATYVIPANQTADVVNTVTVFGALPETEVEVSSRLVPMIALVDESSTPVCDPLDSSLICDTDSHTLTIPVTIVQGAKTLSNTGVGSSMALYLAGAILVTVGGLQFARRKN